MPKIDALNSNIEHIIRLMAPPVQQLLVEPMTFEQAKERVASYMRDNRTASISELAEQLQIDLQMLCEVLDELSEEGSIKERE
jgi:DNA-binding MarR family transcriptional regulator